MTGVDIGGLFKLFCLLLGTLGGTGGGMSLKLVGRCKGMSLKLFGRGGGGVPFKPNSGPIGS
ncbi:hypothetical protein [Endozoicomonas sp. ONNA2]|uniref:hypothetical protein n=1 Tax=Endozoicomonas sp. ONNA2 TaxID=2828741 RepID=UPI002148A9B1|nr:hypothetical protein [Endozoicomonas sp. ONNA2]